MKNFLVVAALVAMTAVAHPAMAAEDGMKLNAELANFPDQMARCGSGGTKFGFHIVGNKLIAGNQKTYRGLFETPIASDGSIRQEFTAPGNFRLVMAGNIQNKQLVLENPNAGCKWNLVFSP